MSEQKKGFFGRLFGGADKQSEEDRTDDTAIVASEPVENSSPKSIEPDDTAEAVPATDTVEEAPEPSQPSEAVETAEADDPTVHAMAEENASSAPEESEETSEEPSVDVPQPKQSWFQRLRQGLSRSSNSLTDGITSIFTKRKLDEDTLQDLEDILIQADLGVETAMAITDRLSDGRFNKEISDEEVRQILADEVEAVLKPVARPLEVDTSQAGPHVILMVGVNGTGKTTTIGKLASKFRAEGKSVMLAAGDTFRAAAIDQLKVWGERTGSPVLSRDVGSDAASLAYDAMKDAANAGSDILMIDTAGRLQNKAELMAELEKVIRVIKKHDENAPHSVLLVLDATTGQNAVNQVEIFGKVAGVTGLVMTKLDGTARGGILVAISAKHKLPVHFIGIGEGVDDLEPFEPGDFAKAIAGLEG
ncbi:signal recognition particle-docking protein FtsY [Coralliovum pocilloporae]|uniref:signal recognition particle-docking protein FtsY n=1 Tax=Coralliovum pocilloporae TaxID=3066369 RepID=UPI0033071028